MKILGVKLTHDGALALIDNGKLIFSIESEKINNNPRHSHWLLELPDIEKILQVYGYSLNALDKIVIDGFGNNGTKIPYSSGEINIEWAEYGHFVTKENVMEPSSFHNKKINLHYNSYMHVSGHIFGTYCTSSFPKRKEDSYILVWDGAMAPQLFYYNYQLNTTDNLGILFPILGIIYPQFAVNFDPYKGLDFNDLSISGKVMAYTSLGNVNNDLYSCFNQVIGGFIDKAYDENSLHDINEQIIQSLINTALSFKIDPIDIFATFQKFLEDLLVSKLREKIQEDSKRMKNLCFCGGNALNIKWNSAIRSSRIFNEMWVPPFANDSGSAIGTACCEMVWSDKIRDLEWSVYSGPKVINKYCNSECESVPFLVEQLARLISIVDEPIIILNDKAEIGPRALGNRSIIAPATKSSMKDLLNEIKDRENYRPVAPICLEEDAINIFEPGTRDPYMLFNHLVRPSWRNKIPAILHIDNSSRLQTINESDNPVLYKLLKEYKKITNIPVLCNTSANFKGKGFFPDVESVIKWNKVNFIWSDNKLYYHAAQKDKLMNLFSIHSFNEINKS